MKAGLKRFFSNTVVVCLCLLLTGAAYAGDPATEVFPLDQIKPGMKAQVRTIFAGTEIEEFELEIIGVLRNAIGPGQDMILVRLLGEKPNYTGIVAGMSGSPVYIDGKLVGALAYKLGTFTREPIGGVTPFEDMLRAARNNHSNQRASARTPSATLPNQFPLSNHDAMALGLPPSAGRTLVPIETPLSYVGIHPQAMAKFSGEFNRLGLLTVQAGGVANPGNTSSLEPGGAVAAALVTGDLSIAATCTITARIGNQLFACGHSILRYGDVELPMARAEIVTTVASEFSSFKVVNIGGLVGSFRHDRISAIAGEIGPVPRMVPVDLTIKAGGRSYPYHYQIFQHPKISPLLLNLTVFSGLASTPESGEGFTYRLKGRMEIAGHTPVVLDAMFGPTDSFFADASFVSANVTRAFQSIYANQFETPTIDRIQLEVELIPERLTASIENAWVDKSEVHPGETVNVKVVLQPYRGDRVVRDIPVRIPPQAASGTLRILVSDAAMLDRVTRSASRTRGFFGAFSRRPRVSSLDQLIALLNRQRRSDHLYVSLFQRTPTILVEDKVLPSVPLSQLNVLRRRQVPGGTSLIYESMLVETSEPLNRVVSGSRWLQVTIR